MQEIFDNFNELHQIDAKMKLSLMSRRPYSIMLKEINFSNDYQAYFNSVMCGDGFADFYKVPSLFSKTEYAQQYFDLESGKTRNLKNFLPFFNKTFLENQGNKDIVEKLLEQGIVSTTMIRNLKNKNDLNVESVLDNFYETAIKSVQFPKKRYILNLESSKVEEENTQFDLFSPLPFLMSDRFNGQIKCIFEQR